MIPDESLLVAIVDDEAPVRRGVARLLEANGFRTRCFDSATAFLDAVAALAPNCIIADLAMPGLSGLELQQILIERNAEYPIIFISGHGDVRSSVVAMRKGAVDFLPKPFDCSELLEALERAIDRDQGQRAAISYIREVAGNLASLTRRERQVFERVADGMMNKQIAGELEITEKTVKVHRARVMRKMDVRSVAELARIAERLAIHSPN